ncbi:MAG: hypothetical protein ACP5MK_02100 [Candidatus Micrarchaeia archaeon]
MEKILTFLMLSLMLGSLAAQTPSNTANSATVNSTIVNQSYKVPEPYSLIVAIIIIVFVVWLGFVFIKDILKVIAILILLVILASVGYSFFTTGTLSLSGVAGYINSIIAFFKYILGISHAVSSAINTTVKNTSGIIPSSA